MVSYSTLYKEVFVVNSAIISLQVLKIKSTLKLIVKNKKTSYFSARRFYVLITNLFLIQEIVY